jgi:hypothetical protein
MVCYERRKQKTTPMKKFLILSLITAITFLNYTVSQAQTCTGTNIGNVNHTVSTNNSTVVITANYSRTLIINANTVTICIASGVTFSGQIEYWNNTVHTINNSGTITANLSYNGGINLNNSGTISSKITMNGGGDIVNSGTISNEIELNGGGDLTNSGTLSHKITMNGGGTLSNSGIINASNRDININDGGNVINTGSITVQDFKRYGNGTLTQSGSGATMNVKKFDVRGTVNLNGGTITVTEDVELNDNSTYNIASGTTLRLNKQLQVNGGSTINVGGQLFVKDELKNYSTVNIAGGYVQTGKLTNSGTITAVAGSGGNTCGGSLSVDNSISNSGSISGGATGLYSCSHSSGQSNVTVIAAPTNGPSALGLSRTGSVITGTFTAPSASTTTPVTGYYVLVANAGSISDAPSCLTDYKVGDVVGSSRIAAVLTGRTSNTFSYTYPGGSCGSLTFKVFPFNSSPAPTNCVKGGVTNTSLAISSTATLPVISGIIAGNQLVCSGTSPGPLTVSQFAGTVSRWEQKIGSGSWTSISSTSGLTTYTPPTITQATSYRAVFSCSGTANGPELSVLIASAATTFVGTTSNWTDLSNWCGSLPTSTSDVTIRNSKSVNINGAGICRNLTIQSGSSVAVMENQTLTIHGSTSNSGTLDGTLGTVSFAGTTQNIPAGNYKNITTNASTKSLPTSGTVAVYGTLTLGGSLTTTSSTINFAGTSNQTIPAITYNNLTLSNGAKTIGGLVNVNGACTLQNNATVALSNQFKTHGSLYLDASSHFLVDNNTDLEINGSAASDIRFASNSNTIRSLKINPATNATITLGSNLNVTGTVDLTNGSINTGAFTLDLGTTGQLLNETLTKKVLGNVKQTKTVGTNATSFPDLGFSIAAGPENMGTMAVTRVLLSTGSSYSIPSVNKVIRRGWSINITGSQPSSGRVITLNWEAQDEASLNLNTFSVYRRNDGSSPWVALTPKAVDFSQTATTRTVNINTNHFSDYTIGEGNETLPVSLSFFKGVKTQEKEVTLSWATVSEINAQSFEVERSFDGNNFETIGTINAAGNSNSLKNYKWVDANLNASKVYYRLRQFDFDGKFEVFSTIVVNMNQTNEKVTASPNPFNNSLVLGYQFEEGVEYSITLSDIRGFQIHNKTLVPSTTSLSQELDLSGLKSGIYTLTVASTTGMSTVRVVKK